MRISLFCLAAGALAAPTFAQTTIQFSDPSGLSAEAEFTLLDPMTLQVRVKNTSTGVPMGFASADQILTGISWDFGAAGEQMGDPQITGGSVATGPMSASVNFDVMSVGASADVSGEYGYGNGGSTGTLPNFVSGNSAGATDFGGANLDGSGNINGPQAGLIPSPMAIVDLGGLGAIQDEIIAVVTLDQMISDLSFLDDHGATVEYGSDAAFITEFPCGTVASVMKVADSGGLNANMALCPDGGDLPVLGEEITLKLDDASNDCSIPSPALTFILISEADPVELIVPNLGCMPGGPGAILIDITQEFHHGDLVPWDGPGNPACHSFVIPNTPGQCGIVCRAQGFFWYPDGGVTSGNGSPRIVATNRVDMTLGAMP